ncbi:YggS family pyridoxal phosphate-dependent enzyme [Paracidobacterium acidisoli]|uniref:Pyridoxal phosphate homeostasis protein n=1 Tax=Paracidobacterium acidisoli TaxID=2303751 RepID=A0A372IPA8_9BACT|nr:YggS family pyridoxal phosphate-dependent enzyme [Paracidobacterium acidisoli]MBT9331083.1 YggS family pyridoxal phosphate-dependent enzyme [Paracidobacterium acidisoli]
MGTVEAFQDRLARIEERIAAACARAGRARGEVKLMAVSKVHPASALAEAVAAGVTLFGENRVQEYQQKAAELNAMGVEGAEVHLIGHLQSNKTAKAAELFDGVDTVDSLRVAERLNDAAAQRGKPLPVLLEMKLSDEAAKTGLDPAGDELRLLLERLPEMPHLAMRGLMTVAPLEGDPECARRCFQKLRDLRDELARSHARLDFSELSMGMSGDFEAAIDEGSTIVRIGTALFGARAKQP